LLAALACRTSERSSPASSRPDASAPAPSWPPGALVDACRAPPPEPPVPGWRREEHGTDVAIYTAHPDDESMYAGGTLAKLAARGRRVALVIASHGEGGRLLAPLADGGFEEKRGLPLEQVVGVRDAETTRAAKALGVDLFYLSDASARLDYGFTQSCEDAMVTWERTLPGGAAGVLGRIVADLRARRPRVVITLDRRDDPQGSLHGHHRATGALVELGARFAATTAAPDLGAPFAVEELLVLVPKGVTPDVVLTVDPAARRRALEAYASQFKPEDISGFGSRPSEGFVVAWRAREAPAVARRTRLADLVDGPP
jgi:LmbE family N-acetylglucosaminyl deacetylase